MYSCGAVNPNFFPAYYPAQTCFHEFSDYESKDIPRLKKSYWAKKGILTPFLKHLGNSKQWYFVAKIVLTYCEKKCSIEFF